MPKIYITDLDGTLLTDEPALSEYSHNGIIRLLEEGVKLTVASARNVASIRQILGELPFELPVVEINGAYISDYHSGKHIIINEIETDICKGICEISDKHNCMPFVSSFDGENDRVYYEGVCNDGMHWFLGDKTEGHSKHAKQIETLSHILSQRIVCFVIIGSKEQMTDLSNEVESEFGGMLDTYFFQNIYSPDWYWLTIHAKNARKDLAIKSLAEYLGTDVSDLVLFGDQMNDIKMMELREQGATTVAVSNAIEEVKSRASEIIGANEEDSVVNYILSAEGLK